MEGQLIKYRLIQKNASYILSASTIGNEIKITIENSNSSYSQTFSVATWKTIGAVFESINTAVDAIQWIKNAMKVHKVKVIEEGSIIKLMFAITEGNKTRHYVIIPISGNSEKASSISAQYNTTSFATSQIAEVQPLTQSIQQNYSQYQSQQYIPQPTITLPTNTSTTTTTNTITTTAYTTLNDKFNYAELGIDPSKVRKSIVNINGPDMAKSIDAEQKLRLSQVGKITTENYVPEDKVVIPYQVIEKPVSGETANTFTNNTVTSSTFNRPYISPADGIITNTNY